MERHTSHDVLIKALFATLIVSLQLSGCGNQNGLLNSQSEKQITKGTIVFYHFDEVSGSTAVDSSGNGFDGTIYGAPRVPGKVGQALQFGLSGSRVEIPPFQNITGSNSVFKQSQEITVDAWLNPTTLTPGSIYQIVGDSYYGKDCFILQLNDGKVEFLLYDNSGTFKTIITSSASLTINTWTYVAVTFDGGVARLYINGVQNSSLATPFPIKDPYNILLVGTTTTFSNGYSNEFPGLIDELRISNVILSATEIKDYYQQTNL